MERHGLTGGGPPDPNAMRPNPSGQTSPAMMGMPQPGAQTTAPPTANERPANRSEIGYHQQQAQLQHGYEGRGGVGPHSRVAAQIPMGYAPKQQQDPVAAAAAAAAVAAHAQHVSYQAAGGAGGAANVAARNAAHARRAMQTRDSAAVRGVLTSPWQREKVSSAAAAIAADDKARAAAAVHAARKYAAAQAAKTASGSPGVTTPGSQLPSSSVSIVNHLGHFNVTPSMASVSSGVLRAASPTGMSGGTSGNSSNNGMSNIGASGINTTTTAASLASSARFMPMVTTTNHVAASAAAAIAPSAPPTGTQKSQQATYYNPSSGLSASIAGTAMYRPPHTGSSGGSYASPQSAAGSPAAAMPPHQQTAISWGAAQGGGGGSGGGGRTGGGGPGTINSTGSTGSINVVVTGSTGNVGNSVHKPPPQTAQMYSATTAPTATKPVPAVAVATTTATPTSVVPTSSSASSLPLPASTGGAGASTSAVPTPGASAARAARTPPITQSTTNAPTSTTQLLGLEATLSARNPSGATPSGAERDGYTQQSAMGVVAPSADYGAPTPPTAATRVPGGTNSSTAAAAAPAPPGGGAAGLIGTPDARSGGTLAPTAVRDLHEQMSPSALQAIKQISKVGARAWAWIFTVVFFFIERGDVGSGLERVVTVNFA